MNLYDYFAEPKTLLGYESIQKIRENVFSEIMQNAKKYRLSIDVNAMKAFIRDLTSDGLNDEEIDYVARDWLISIFDAEAISIFDAEAYEDLYEDYFDNGGIDRMIKLIISYTTF